MKLTNFSEYACFVSRSRGLYLICKIFTCANWPYLLADKLKQKCPRPWKVQVRSLKALPINLCLFVAFLIADDLLLRKWSMPLEYKVAVISFASVCWANFTDLVKTLRNYLHCPTYSRPKLSLFLSWFLISKSCILCYNCRRWMYVLLIKMKKKKTSTIFFCQAGLKLLRK